MEEGQGAARASRWGVRTKAPACRDPAAQNCTLGFNPDGKYLESRLAITSAKLEARTKELLETQRIARIGTFTYDLDGREFDWSDELYGIAGHEPEAFKPCLRRTLACIHPQDRRAAANALQTVAGGAEDYQAEFRIVRPDGMLRRCRVTCRRELDAGGRCVRLVGVCQDIDELRSAEERLRESQEQLRCARYLHRHIPWVAAADGAITEVGSRMFEVTGARRDDALGSRWLDMLHPEDIAPTSEIWRESIRTGVPFETEYRLRIADGGYRWCRASAGARRGDDGEIVRWYGIVEDIHDRKLADAALSAAEALNRGIMEISPDSIVLLNGDGGIIFANSRAASELGQNADESVGKNWILLLPPRLRAKARTALARAAAGRIGKIVGKDAADPEQVRWCEITLTPIAGEGTRRFLVVSRDVTDSKRAEDRLRWMANHDSLTKMPNRLLLQQKLDDWVSAAPRDAAPMALLLLDLDDFKRTNDALGHDAGDALLCAFAERLVRSTRPDDFVARLGGDEFALLLSGVSNAEEAQRAFDRILVSLREPCVYGGGILECAASVGAAFFPQHGTTRSELMKHADLALYAAKAEGGGAMRVFDPRMKADMHKRLSMLSFAKKALTNDWIEPFYQPKFDLKTGALVGFEALLRCSTPESGVHGPETISAAFQDLELAAKISDRIIDRVIDDISRWLAEDVEFGHVAVNAAAAEFRRGNFAEQVLERLAARNIPHHCFQVEVTETVFLGRGAECVELALKTLSNAGVKIALDDFGTGYASLSHLKRFPVDILKIDQSFVRNLEESGDDAAIIHAVVNLGRSLGISVVAEGIEKEAQQDFLIAAGCKLGQGFFYSPAVPAVQVPYFKALKGRKAA